MCSFDQSNCVVRYACIFLFSTVIQTLNHLRWGWLNVHCVGSYYSNWIHFFPCVLHVNWTTPYWFYLFPSIWVSRGVDFFTLTIFLALVFVQIELLQFVAYCSTFAKQVSPGLLYLAVCYNNCLLWHFIFWHFSRIFFFFSMSWWGGVMNSWQERFVHLLCLDCMIISPSLILSMLVFCPSVCGGTVCPAAFPLTDYTN